MTKNRKNTGICLFCIGIIFILCAAALYCCNMCYIKNAERSAAEITAQIEEQITYDYSDKPDISDLHSPAVITIDGESYIGLLSVPSLGLRLPVRADISYSALRESPCRYSGAVSTDNLVIAAHNYPAHFGSLNRLANGESVQFIDAGGNITEYTVIYTEILAPNEVHRIIYSDYDLTLFTCTIGGGSRVTVRCSKI